MSGQLCRLAEGLSYNDITLAHSHPLPSPQKSDTCGNPVQNFKTPSLSFRVTFWTPTNMYHPGICGHGRYKLVPAKLRPFSQGHSVQCLHSTSQ